MKKASSWRWKGYLGAAFAAAVLTGAGVGIDVYFIRPDHPGPAPSPVEPLPVKPAPPRPAPPKPLPVKPPDGNDFYIKSAGPRIINVFNSVATQASPRKDPYWSTWHDVWLDQADIMRQKKVAVKYNSFLGRFDHFRNEPLKKMAAHVNALVEKNVSYSDTFYGSDDPLVPPAETVFHGKGDCQDQSALQYAILRHLGVPASRLFIANVNAEGSRKAPDHVILLLNVAPIHQKPEFVILNDSPPVIPADNLRVQKTWNTQNQDGKWVKCDFVLYDIRNEKGFWRTSLTPRDYIINEKDIASRNTPAVAANSSLKKESAYGVT